MQRLVAVLCVLSMLAGQLMGLHFHRHAPGLDGAGASATSIHRRDTGVHLQGSADHAAHHAAADRASHPGEDVEIDPLAGGLVKFLKNLLGAGFFLCTLLLLVRAVSANVPLRPLRSGAVLHPALFVLRPPSNAPPLKLSLIR